MSETSPSTAQLEARSGTTDASTGQKYVTKGAGLDWYSEFADSIDRTVKAITAPGGGRIYKDGTATFAVRPLRAWNGILLSHVGASAQSLTVNATNYIYMRISGTTPVLTKNTSGFPPLSTTPHIPLAQIVVGASTYDCTTGITDKRGHALFSVLSRMTAAHQNEAATWFSAMGGSASDATTYHNHRRSLSAGFQLGISGRKLVQSATGIHFRTALNSAYVPIRATSAVFTTVSAVTLNALSAMKYKGADVKTYIPKIKFNVGTESGNVIRTSCLMTDFLSAQNANRFLFKAWLASSIAGGTMTMSNNSALAWSTGTILSTIVTKKSWLVITNSAGRAVLYMRHSGARTFYLNSEIDGRIFTATIAFT